MINLIFLNIYFIINKMLNNGLKSLNIKSKGLSPFYTKYSKFFSGGPFNPTHYKYNLVGTRRAT